MAAPFPLVAVDVGNSRYKFGLFTRLSGAAIPVPEQQLAVDLADDSLAALEAWLPADGRDRLHWWLASVHRPATTRLVDWLRNHDAQRRITLLTSADLPLAFDLPRPDMVGIDRLLSAVVANRRRESGRPAVVVDIGTAITVDLVTAAGAFAGGAILPGMTIAARALHAFTDLLPLVDMTGLPAPPPPLGQWTREAMQSGLYWGAVGGIRHLVHLYAAHAGGDPHLLVTGGGSARSLAEQISPRAEYVPHATLSGIALAAMSSLP